jgi:hypothetical protein
MEKQFGEFQPNGFVLFCQMPPVENFIYDDSSNMVEIFKKNFVSSSLPKLRKIS